MDSFPVEYVDHHIPTIVVIGLERDKQVLALTETNTPAAKRAKQDALVLSFMISISLHLQSLNDRTIWDSNTLLRFVMMQQLSLPPRIKNQFSPKNTNSPMYPDGIICPAYVDRFKSAPSVVVNIRSLWDSAEKMSVKKDPLGGISQTSSLEHDQDQILCTRVTEERFVSIDN